MFVRIQLSKEKCRLDGDGKKGNPLAMNRAYKKSGDGRNLRGEDFND